MTEHNEQQAMSDEQAQEILDLPALDDETKRRMLITLAARWTRERGISSH